MVNVAVVGDLMLDKSEYYRTGERENPENPLVPLVKKSTLKEEYSLGGAGNLAANIQSMIGNVLLLGPFNPKMPLSQLIMDISHANNLRFQGIQTSAPVIVKTRQYINNQPKLRIDEGDDDPIVIASEEKQRIVNILLHGQPSHIIISDYAKGTIDGELVDFIKDRAKETGSKILVDTKPKHIEMFRGVYLIKPNFKEFREMSGNPSLINSEEDIAREGLLFVKKYMTNLVVTRSEKGATLITKEGDIFHLPTHTDSHDLVDVTGAGDTFLAGLVAGLVKGLPLQKAVELGNKASGIAVKQKGTSVVTAAQLEI